MKTYSMMTDKNHTNKTPWQSPEITTLSIRSTEQLDPPDVGAQS